MGSPALSAKWQTACLVTKTPSYLRGDSPGLMHLLESFSPLSSLSTCVFSFSSLWNWLWPSSLCWCCSDRKTHPPSAALSHSLLDSHWLPVRGDITLLLCLSASLLLCSLPLSLSLSSSLSADSGHSFIAPPRPLSISSVLSPFSI